MNKESSVKELRERCKNLERALEQSREALYTAADVIIRQNQIIELYKAADAIIKQNQIVDEQINKIECDNNKEKVGGEKCLVEK
ncbi:MAG: hypothetical protein RSB59_07250 [Clostridia bacterium]